MFNGNPFRLDSRHAASEHSSAHPVNRRGTSSLLYNYSFNPAADQFRPSAEVSTGNGIMSPGSPPSHRQFRDQVHPLDREVVALRTEVDDLKESYKLLHELMDAMRKGGWDVKVGPFQDQSIATFKQQLDELTAEKKRMSRTDNDEAANGSVSPHLCAASVASGTSSAMPPHLKSRNGPDDKNASLPPHLRPSTTTGSSINNSAVTSTNNPLVIDGNVDSGPFKPKTTTAEPTPPISPSTTIRPEHASPAMEPLALNPSANKNWTPSFITTASPLPTDTAVKIPPMSAMKTFSPDFLRNTFGGYMHSPGLMFIPPSPGPCILRNRTYYTLDAHYEPYLPQQPGLHGAKLVPFFNTNPEDEYTLPADCGSSSANVPLFVLLPDAHARKRYVYFGHYSQTRWSDKLDYDRMQQCVPAHVRAYWAEELAATGRPEWITRELQMHFFPRPQYEGCLPGAHEDEGGSVASGHVSRRVEKVKKEVGRYVEGLREWEKEARMRTSLIKKEFILQAFERADADDPPALRLWWEYLECIDWKADFYDMIVTLQGRDAAMYERF